MACGEVQWLSPIGRGDGPRADDSKLAGGRQRYRRCRRQGSLVNISLGTFPYRSSLSIPIGDDIHSRCRSKVYSKTSSSLAISQPGNGSSKIPHTPLSIASLNPSSGATTMLSRKRHSTGLKSSPLLKPFPPHLSRNHGPPRGRHCCPLLAEYHMVSRCHARYPPCRRQDQRRVPPAYNVEEMTYALKTADAKFLMTHPGSLEVAVEAAKAAGVPKEKIFLLEGEAQGFKTVKDLVKEGDGLGEAVPCFNIPKGKTNGDICGFLSFSSGTTGLPKAVSF